MLRPQAVTDVGVGHADVDVPVHELAVHRPGLDEVVRDVVHDREVRAGLEDHRHVREIRRAVLVGGQRRDPHMRMAEAAVGHPGPQDRVHLGHVRAPEHEGIGMLEIVVATHRLVHAEGADEGDGGGGHAVAGVRIEVVGAKARPHQLGGGIALPDRPLARAEHADRLGSLFLEYALELPRHLVEGLVPGDGLELAVLRELPVPHAQERLGEPIAAVHDLGEEVALDAVEAAIDLGLHVAVGGNDLAFFHPDHHTAAGAAEAAGRLRPLQLKVLTRQDVLGNGREGNTSGCGCGSGCLGLQDGAAREVHGSTPALGQARNGGRRGWRRARRRGAGSR